MSGKQTKGWMIKVPAHKRMPERWMGTSSGSPFKAKGTAISRMSRYNSSRKRLGQPLCELYRVDMFYTPEDET